jgi:hypothetical protein
MKIKKKRGGVVEKRREEESKFMPHAPVGCICSLFVLLYLPIYIF